MTSSVGVQRGGPPQWLALLGFGGAVALAALVGVLGVSGTTAEYQSLRQPSWAPPPWLFGPVWTVLYLAIAVAGWLVWRRAGFGLPIGLYALQLLCNAIWTPLFFGFGRYGWALADIAVLWVLIVATIVAFWRVRRSAAVLMVPYLLWVSYATALNAAIWVMNT